MNGTVPNQVVTTDYGTPDIDIADVTATSPTDSFPTTNFRTPVPSSVPACNMNHCNCPLIEKEDQFQLVNNWTKTIGNHAVKFGADLRYARNLRVPSD